MELRRRLEKGRELLASLEAASLADEAAGIRDAIENLDAEIQRSETVVKAWIDTIDDWRTQTAFRLRFLCGMSWTAAAKATGGTTSNSMRMLVCRYLEAHHDE
ncbi:MAG: hypothetical protein K2O18_08195 [Oscillospiraceae bacterium]|nr:hypothetical protein [Oscillospiraceae bacterium]